MKKRINIVFAPGAFDNFEGSQEELDLLIEEIKQWIVSGEFFENSKQFSIDELETSEPVLEKKLKSLFFQSDSKNRTLH
jgi:hypothetical protein